jgi:phage terminase small subunit
MPPKSKRNPSKPTTIPSKVPSERPIKTRSTRASIFVAQDQATKPLTEQQQKLLDAYFETNSPLQAYFIVRPDMKEKYDNAPPESSIRKNIRNKASVLLHHPRVWARVEEAQAVAQNKFNQTAQKFVDQNVISKMRIVEELAKIAFADPRKAMNWDKDGSFNAVASDQLDDDTAAAISGVKVVKGKSISTKNGEISIPDLVVPELHNKREALMDLARVLGYTEEKKDTGQKINVQFIIEK